MFTKRKQNAASGFWGTQEQTQWLASNHLTKGGHSDPKNKYHAINSVYYIFSIQVYITFLSIQVHIIIHIVLLCLLGCIFHFKVLVNFGSQLVSLNRSDIHVTSVPFCVSVSCGCSSSGCSSGVGMGGVQSHDQALGPWKCSTQTWCYFFFPQCGFQSKSLRGREPSLSCPSSLRPRPPYVSQCEGIKTETNTAFCG